MFESQSTPIVLNDLRNELSTVGSKLPRSSPRKNGPSPTSENGATQYHSLCQSLRKGCVLGGTHLSARSGKVSTLEFTKNRPFYVAHFLFQKIVRRSSGR